MLKLKMDCRIWMAVTACLIAVASVGFRQWRHNGCQTRVPISNSVYVWQTKWTPAVSRAVETIAPRVGGFMVFGGLVRAEGRRVAGVCNSPDWQALGETNTSITIVVRGGDSLAPAIEKNGVIDTVAAINSIWRRSSAEAAAAGCRIAGLQLDFDCPTSKLWEYKKLLSAVKSENPEIEFSITALPTWLNSREFASLVAETSYFVLQVHGTDKPGPITSPPILCRYDRVRKWIADADKLNVPFVVALPTYASRAVYGADGKFNHFAAETAVEAGDPSLERLAAANPVQIAALVRDIHTLPPSNCRGITWFRLPVEGDRLNWPSEVLTQVMDGNAPKVAITAAVREPEPGLFEVWASNSNPTSVPGEIHIRLKKSSVGIVASDILNGFRETANTELIGPIPNSTVPKLVAWYRAGSPADAGNRPITIEKVDASL